MALGVRLSGKEKKDLKKALLRVGFILEAEIKRRAPVDTGRLRASYQVVEQGSNVLVGTEVEYAFYQEFGTRKGIRFTPHVRPAIDALKNRKVI